MACGFERAAKTCVARSRVPRIALAALVVAAAVSDLHTYHLDNGLVLHVAPGPATQVAAVQAWVAVGAADERPHEVGLAHAVEHMLFKGSSRYAIGELVRTIERGGGEINAWTALDHTVYHAVLGRDHLDGAIDAIGDALLAPAIDPAEVAREREVILEEIRQTADDPARAVTHSLFATAFATHPYRRPVIGTPERVRAITERELVAFFREHYVAENVTLVVAGDVDVERARRSVERRFRAMPAGRRRTIRPVEPPQTAPRASATARDIRDAYLAVGFPIPGARHPDLAALDVAAILLGQGESARLPRLLRDRDPRVAGADATIHALRDPGLLALTATTDAGSADRTVGRLVTHAAELAADLGEDELDKARIAAETGFIRHLETAQGRARSLGWYAAVTGDPQFGEVYLNRIRALRCHDLERVLRTYLRPERANVAAVLPKRTPATGARFAQRAEQRVRKALAPRVAKAPLDEQRVVLANGMTVVVRRDPAVPVVAMRAVWRGGQRVEPLEQAGASTLLARTITRGCGALAAPQVADRADRLGGTLGGIAGRNSFGIAAEWLARTWQPGLELLADCILDPQLADAEIARERSTLLDDQRAQDENATQLVFRAFSEALYGVHPYARDVLGTPKAVSALDRAALLALYRERYPLSGLTLAIVGDLDVAEAIARVRRRFERAPVRRLPRAAPARVAPSFVEAPEAEVYRYLARSQAHIVIGFPGATLDAADRFALEVVVAVLGGQGGRLFGELRERRALVYRISAHSIEGVEPGFVAIYFSCAPDKADEAVAAVRDQLAQLRSGGITDLELDRARSYLLGSHQIAMQRRAAVANAMAYHEAYGLGAWTGYDAAIRAVRIADLTAAVARYLRAEAMITATVRPPSTTPAATRRSRVKR
jgi:zinc protease